MRFSKGYMLPGFLLSAGVGRLPPMTPIARDKSPDGSICCGQWYDTDHFSSCFELNYELVLIKTKCCRVADFSSLFMTLK